MSKIAITADVHAHPHASFNMTSADNVNSRLRRVTECLDWMLSVSVRKKCGAFVIAGDLFHARKSVPVVALDMVADVLAKHCDDIKIIILVGNHDMSTDGAHNSVTQFEGLCAAVVSEPCVLDVAGVSVGFIPYVDTQEELVAAFDTVKGATGVIGHFGTGDEMFSAFSMETQGHLDIGAVSGIEKFEWIELGHYHRRHNVLPHAGYCGSPLQHTWAESGETKGFTIHDSRRGRRFIENKRSPRFVKVDLSSAESAPEVPRARDYVKITGEVSASRDAVSAQCADLVNTLQQPPQIHVRVEHETVTRVDLSDASASDILTKYMDFAGADEDSREALHEFGRDLLSGEIE